MTHRFKFFVLLVDLIASLFAVMFLITMVSLMKTPEAREAVHHDGSPTTRRPEGFSILTARFFGPDQTDHWCASANFKANKDKLHWSLILDDRIVIYDPFVGRPVNLFPGEPGYDRAILDYFDRIRQLEPPVQFASMVAAFPLYYDIRDPMQEVGTLHWCEIYMTPSKKGVLGAGSGEDGEVSMEVIDEALVQLEIIETASAEETQLDQVTTDRLPLPNQSNQTEQQNQQQAQRQVKQTQPVRNGRPPPPATSVPIDRIAVIFVLLALLMSAIVTWFTVSQARRRWRL